MVLGPFVETKGPRLPGAKPRHGTTLLNTSDIAHTTSILSLIPYPCAPRSFIEDRERFVSGYSDACRLAQGRDALTSQRTLFKSFDKTQDKLRELVRSFQGWRPSSSMRPDGASMVLGPFAETKWLGCGAETRHQSNRRIIPTFIFEHPTSNPSNHIQVG